MDAAAAAVVVAAAVTTGAIVSAVVAANAANAINSRPTLATGRAAIPPGRFFLALFWRLFPPFIFQI